jgi:hypothetical protein
VTPAMHEQIADAVEAFFAGSAKDGAALTAP